LACWVLVESVQQTLNSAKLKPRREQLVGNTASIRTGLIFGLTKAVSAFHALAIAVLEFVLIVNLLQ
jgi:hypothetical protein